MTKINMSTGKIIYVDERPEDVVKRLQSAGKNYVEMEEIKPRRKPIWINPCHVVNISAEFSD